MELVYKKTGVLFKLLPCLLIIMFFVMCIYGSSVYASFTFTYNDVSHSVPDLPEDGNSYYLIVESNSSYYLFTSSTCIRYCDSSTYSGYGEVYGLNAILYRKRGSTWDLDDNYGSEMWRSSFNNSSNFIYCNYDILMKTSNDVVFQAPPQQVEALGIIAEKTQGVEMDKTLAEIVGILPVILLTIVGILAVRKGIQFLMARMKQV